MCILAYHMVDSGFTWGVTRVTPHLFSRQISTLCDSGKIFLTISDYINCAESDSRKLIALTFDDGYESVYKYALPILQRQSIPATVFINPAYVGQYNTWDVNFGKRVKHLDWKEIRRLKEIGWEIGSHGMTHHDLTQLSEFRLERELLISRQIIEKRLGGCSSVFSYPFGNSNHKVHIACNKNGYNEMVAMGKTFQQHIKQRDWPRVGIYIFDLPALLMHKVLPKSGFFITLLERVFDACSNLTVKAKSKKWRIEKN